MSIYNSLLDAHKSIDDVFTKLSSVSSYPDNYIKSREKLLLSAILVGVSYVKANLNQFIIRYRQQANIND